MLATRTNRLPPILACIAAALTGCSITTDYLGRSYPPTTTLDLFYAEHEITRPYQVMGTARLEADAQRPVADFEAELIAQAKARGADAAIIDSLEWIVVGESESFTVDDFGHHHRSTSGSSRTTLIRNKVMTARLLRYTAAHPSPTPAQQP